MADDIDFVLAWVDGDDPQWQEERRAHLPPEGADARPALYRDWGLLPYWFRGVEAFAPWVRTIHFITWGHLPAWLNTAHPKLRIVRHGDFIPPEYLPTFNPNPIELNLHRIPELCEQFVYFNDDMFLLRRGTPSDFVRNGLPRDRLILSTITPNDESISSIIFNDVRAINRHFGKHALLQRHWMKVFHPLNGIVGVKSLLTLPFPRFTGFQDEHLPGFYTKRLFEEVWAAERDLLRETCSHKYRQRTDVNQWLMRYWLLAQGLVSPCSRRRGRFFQMEERNDQLLRAIRSQRYKMICCNDDSALDFEVQKRALHEAFDAILPKKSGFEI